MITLKTIEETLREQTWIIHPAYFNDLFLKKQDVEDVLTQDRAAIHTSLIKAVEGLPISKEVLNPNPLSLGDVMISKDRVFTIINSIFKE